MRAIYILGNTGALLTQDIPDDADYPVGWEDSPAKFGIETCPGAAPDPELKKIRDGAAHIPPEEMEFVILPDEAFPHKERLHSRPKEPR